jgi:hypothetical protein
VSLCNGDPVAYAVRVEMEYQVIGSGKEHRSRSRSNTIHTHNSNTSHSSTIRPSNPSTPTTTHTTIDTSHHPSSYTKEQTQSRTQKHTGEDTHSSAHNTYTRGPPPSKPEKKPQSSGVDGNQEQKVRVLRPPTRVRRRTEGPPSKPLPSTPVPVPSGLNIRKSKSSSVLNQSANRGTVSTVNTVTPTEIISHYNSQPATPTIPVRKSFESLAQSEISRLIVPRLQVPSTPSTLNQKRSSDSSYSFNSLELLSGAYESIERSEFLGDKKPEKTVEKKRWEPKEAGSTRLKESSDTLSLARFIRNLPSREVEGEETAGGGKVAKKISLHSAFVPLSASVEVLSNTESESYSGEDQGSMSFQGHAKGNRNTSLSRVVNDNSSMTRVLKVVHTYYVCMWCREETEILPTTTEKFITLNNHAITPDYYRFIVFDPCGRCIDAGKFHLESISRRKDRELCASEEIVRRNVAKRKGIFADEKPKVSIEIVYYPPNPNNILLKDKENKVVLYNS